MPALWCAHGSALLRSPTQDKVINSRCCEQDFSSWAYPDIETYEDCVADKAEAKAEAEAAREEVKQAEAEAQAETEAWDAWLKQEAWDEAEAWSEYHEEPVKKQQTKFMRSPRSADEENSAAPMFADA